MSEGGGRPRRSSLLRFAEDVTGTLATRVLTMGFGLFTGVITARALGPENRGVFASWGMSKSSGPDVSP